MYTFFQFRYIISEALVSTVTFMVCVFRSLLRNQNWIDPTTELFNF